MDKASDFIKLLANIEELNWLLDDVALTISNGITEEAMPLDPDKFSLTDNISKADKKKLANYEKTRGFTDSEICALVVERLKFLHVEIPEYKSSSLELFKAINPNLEQIEFVDRDEEFNYFNFANHEATYTWDTQSKGDKKNQVRFNNFINQLEEIYE